MLKGGMDLWKTETQRTLHDEWRFASSGKRLRNRVVGVHFPFRSGLVEELSFGRRCEKLGKFHPRWFPRFHPRSI